MGSITVIWNQYAPEVKSGYWTMRDSTYITSSFNGDGSVSIEYLKEGNVAYLAAMHNPATYQVQQEQGDLWYASYCVNASQSAIWSGEFVGNARSNVKKTFQANIWGRWSALGIATTRKKPFYFPYCESASIGMTAQAKSPIWINLTQMFGAGNEPATVEEFENLCVLNGINLEEYQVYDSGTEITWKMPDLSPKLMGSRRAIITNSPHIEAVLSDNMASFKTDIKAPLKSVKAYFSLIQSGTGDPSPDNVRPISGYTGITVTHTGVNVVQCDTFPNGEVKGVTFTGTRNSDGELESVSVIGTGTNSNIFRNLNYEYGKLKWPPDGRYATYTYTQGVDIIPAQTYGMPKDIYGADGQRAKTDTDLRWRYFDLAHDASHISEWLRFQTVPNYSEGISFNAIAHPMVCIYDDAGCEFEPYKGKDITVSWQTEAGTLYGGYIDLVSGELICTYGYKRCVGNDDWLISGAISGFCAHRPTLLNVTSKFTPTNAYKTPISDKLTGVGRYTTGLYQVTLNANGHIYFGAPEELSTSEAVNDWVKDIGGIDIVYPLSTPIIYQLSSQTIKTLKGRNNIWSSAKENIEVKYWTH